MFIFTEVQNAVWYIGKFGLISSIYPAALRKKHCSTLVHLFYCLLKGTSLITHFSKQPWAMYLLLSSHAAHIPSGPFTSQERHFFSPFKWTLYQQKHGQCYRSFALITGPSGGQTLVINNYWMRLSMISRIIQTEVNVIWRSRRRSA